MLAAFERAGLMCDIYFTCGDARTAMTMAEKGLGIAILPASMQTLSSKLTSCRISGADLTTEILLAWRKEQLPEEIQNRLCHGNFSIIRCPSTGANTGMMQVMPLSSDSTFARRRS